MRYLRNHIHHVPLTAGAIDHFLSVVSADPRQQLCIVHKCVFCPTAWRARMQSTLSNIYGKTEREQNWMLRCMFVELARHLWPCVIFLRYACKISYQVRDFIFFSKNVYFCLFAAALPSYILSDLTTAAQCRSLWITFTKFNCYDVYHSWITWGTRSALLTCNNYSLP